VAKAITQIERKESNVEEERSEDIQAIVKQIADNREAIQDSLTILQELKLSGTLDIIKGFLRTRDQVGALALEQLNQAGVHHMMKNAINLLGLLAKMNPDELDAIFSSMSKGLQKVSENTYPNEHIGVWNLLKSAQDPNVKTSLNTMLTFLNGMGQSLNNK